MELQTRYDFPRVLKGKNFKVGVELGVKEGYFSLYLLKHTTLNVLFSVDSWRDGWSNGKKEAYKSLSYFGGRSKILNMRTSEAAKYFRENNIKADFIYIDANHKYSAVKQDIEEWWPFVRPGGILAGHDYVEGEGVIPAVDEFIKNAKLSLNLTGDHMKSWWVVKPEEKPTK